ncbi:MAG: GTP 3',8-cyclase MoaA [Fimbriimonadaceae bacterium]|nr:GTP 3',8-cyclase MoaA [Fimbriimonadaceae bacterium]
MTSPAAVSPRPLVDSFERRISYLRVSITDRCNLRCVYCMPAAGVEWKPRPDILTIEEILAVVAVARDLGVRKVRVTGGEPLVRRGCVDLIAGLRELGIAEIGLTTNGIRFAEQAEALQAAGLTRVNISLDTLDPERFRQITRGGDLARVHAAIDAALAFDLAPRLNVVAMRGFNDDELPALADLARERPLTVRFIEVMPFTGLVDQRLRQEAPVAADCDTRSVEALSLEEVRARLGIPESALAATPLGQLPQLSTAGPAEYVRLPGYRGEIGFIASMHQHICERCNRIRMTADGWLKPCLLGDERIAVRDAVRSGDRAAVVAAFEELMRLKPAQGLRAGSRPEAMTQVGG